MTADELKAARQAIKNTDWDAYWRKVDEGVAKDVEAYAKSRAMSRFYLDQLFITTPL